MAYDFVEAALKNKTTTTTSPVIKTPSRTTVSPSFRPPTAQPSFANQAINAAIKYNPVSNYVRNTAAGLGFLGEALSVPQNAFGGFLRGTRKSAEKNAPLVKTGQKQLVPSMGEDFIAGIKNIPEGVKSKTTPGSYLTEDVLKTKNKYAKAGIQLGTDIAVDPLNFAGGAFTKVAPTLSKAAPILKKIPGYQKARDVVGAFEYGYNVPKPLLGKIEELHRKTSDAAEYASRVASPLKYGKDGKELPQETQRILGDILDIRGNGTGKAVTVEEQALIDKYGPLADKTLRDFAKLAQEQIKRGADPAIFERLLGKYYGKRSYTSKLDKEVLPFMQTKKPRLDLSVYQKREDIPEDVRKAMGEIKEPAYGAATAAYTEKKNIAVNDFFRWVAKKHVDQGENLVQLPKSDRLGVLSGRKIPAAIKPYIDQIAEAPTNTASERLISFFKKGKTIYSPKQLARNVVTSQVQAFLNPSGRWDSFRRIPEAISESSKKGKYYQELKKTGEIGGTFADELNRFAPPELKKFKKQGLYDKVGEVGSKIQQKAEEVAKLQVFINERKAGKSIQEARKAAEETAFNYQKVSPLVSRLRSGKKHLGPLPLSVPFLTYPLKAAQLTARTLAKHPERLAAIGKGERAIENLSEPQDRTNMPSYLKDAVRVSSPDKEGTSKYINSKYMYPWGNLGEISPLPLGLTPDPIIQEIISQWTGKDAFLATQAIKEGKSVSTVKDFPDKLTPFGLAGRARHLGETFLPTPVRSATKLIDAAMKNKRYATSPGVIGAIIQELGLPMYKYNTDEGESFAMMDKKTQRKELRSKIRSFRENYQGSLPAPIYDRIEKYYDTLYDKTFE